MPAPRPRPPILAAARVVCVAAALATGIALGCDPPNAPRTYDVPTPVKAPSHDKDTPMTEHEATQDPEDVAPGGLTTEDVARYPQPGMLQPSHLGFAPDDRFITYLRTPDASLSKQLYAFDPETGEERLLAEPPGGGETEENLSREEKLRRERQRVRGLGITRYAWSHHEAATPRMLVPMRGGIYVIDAPTAAGGATLREVVAPGDKPALDPLLSRDGAQIAYVQDDELYVVPTAGGAPRQLTKGARGTGKSHGLAEYIAQEEMGRSHGYWWSRSGDYLAFTEIDETHIPKYRIVHQGKESTGPDAYEDHGYPFAGEANAKVRLGVVASRGGAPRWLDLSGEAEDDDEYLARVHWLADGRLVAEVENRAQTRLRLLAFDPRSGKRSELLREESDVWINLHHSFRALKKPDAKDKDAAPDEASGGFLWASERTGFNHLYLYAADGALIRPLTSGDWPVDGIAGVDEDAKVVYFTAGREHPTEHHLYSVPFAGGEPTRITQAAGSHHVVLDHGFERFIDLFSSPDQPPTVTLRKLSDGAELRALPVPEDPRLKEMTLPPPELVELDTRDGVRLHGAIYRPPVERFGHGPYPTMVSVYGGPHAQRVTKSWGLTVDMRAQLLASRGYLVFKLDNRGSARRGLAFEGALRHDMGNVEVQDQVDGVDWLANQGLADKHHVGIYGWSYGGYMAAMALARAPETFKLGIAGAPVTHWDGYDTHYTERYMGTPQQNPKGYEDSSVMAHVDALAGDLMIVHGLIDENVHFRHAARLINAMIRARKPYELLLFPDERHMPRRLEDRVFMEDQLLAFIKERL
ncbi:MAG: DPP IV N-terminal domain-containing protein [Myxococcales bacterium]|nr:DPP IV N-terminal domain-containing protein [Myxococcales bacterium]